MSYLGDNRKSEQMRYSMIISSYGQFFAECNKVYEVKSKKLRILSFRDTTKINLGGGEVGESWSGISDPRTGGRPRKYKNASLWEPI